MFISVQTYEGLTIVDSSIELVNFFLYIKFLMCRPAEIGKKSEGCLAVYQKMFTTFIWRT